jgi:hypothetical protein
VAGRDWHEMESSEEGGPVRSDRGVVTLQNTNQDTGDTRGEFISEFVRTIGAHCHWDRAIEHVPV